MWTIVGMACVNLSGLAVITADIEVLEGWLQNQQLLVITSLINL